METLCTFCRFIDRMDSLARREPAREVLEELLRAVGYEAFLFDSLEAPEAEVRWSNVRDYAEWLGRKGQEEGRSLLELSQTVALLTMLDKDEGDADAVQLGTLHAAKGLEFDHVFLVGVEEGLLPHRESVEADSVEEERRLLYVGVTRARRSLAISYCARRPSGKEFRPCEPSRFLVELGGDLRRTSGAEVVSDRSSASARLAALKALLGSKTGTG
jgi:ATP-dependent DNA helicase Rep